MVYCLLSIIYYQLSTINYLLSIIYYLLSIIYYLLSIVYCLSQILVFLISENILYQFLVIGTIDYCTFYNKLVQKNFGY